MKPVRKIKLVSVDFGDNMTSVEDEVNKLLGEGWQVDSIRPLSSEAKASFVIVLAR